MNIENCVLGRSRVLGIVGNPVEHTVSPQLHNSISRFLQIDAVYVPFKVERNELENAIKGLKALNVLGVNVTVPYKNDVIQYIDEISKEALLMGAVNTVKNVDGKLYGYNTDADGFLKSFEGEACIGFENKKVVLLGAGGAARSMAVKIALEGADKIVILNRTLSKALDITNIINKNIAEIAACYSYVEPMAREEFYNADIIINTTSIGMYPEIDNSPIDDTYSFSTNQIVYDVIYNPSETTLLKTAREKGCKTINGLGMLFFQGIYSYEIWTGLKLSEEFIKDAYLSITKILLK